MTASTPRQRITKNLLLVVTLILAFALALDVSGQGAPPSQGTSTPSPPALPRGKKLVMKDGSFQLVKTYQVEGGRVRYYSVERSEWEEVPAAVVDWDATHKAEVAEEQEERGLVKKAEAEEEARKAAPVDVDASIEVAPGAFLPPGEGVFLLEGHSVLPLKQSEADVKLNKGRLLGEILSPIPVIPTRHTVELKGARAAFRVANREPEFYMRTADGREPNLELVRARVHGHVRQVEYLDTLFTQQSEKAKTLPLQRWEVAKGVYRFTLGQPLTPGEYALAEIVPGEGMNFYLWDFGVDGASLRAAGQKK